MGPREKLVEHAQLMVIFRVVSWNDIVGHSQAWNTLIWFATLVTMAGGLAETKFLDWLAASLVPMLSGLSAYATIAGVVLAFYFLHYFFASITAHTATLFPLFLAVAIKIPVVSPVAWALTASSASTRARFRSSTASSARRRKKWRTRSRWSPHTMRR